jgi:hypothetical protein
MGRKGPGRSGVEFVPFVKAILAACFVLAAQSLDNLAAVDALVRTTLG